MYLKNCEKGDTIKKDWRFNLLGVIVAILGEMKEVIRSIKSAVIENIHQSKDKTGSVNPYGDKTLVLDQLSEDTAIEILQSSGHVYAVLTEEQGLVLPDKKPEFLTVLDPIDGSANLERGIPLCSVGISVVPYQETMTSDDVEISIIDSFFTDEIYVAITGKGVTKNGEKVTPAQEKASSDLIISYDTKRPWKGEFGQSSKQVLEGVHDMRRTGSNLLDLCWTASGSLDAMIDLRGILPIVHVSGSHMVFEAGGFVLEQSGKRMVLPIEKDVRMSYVAASSENLARYLLDLFKK